ncbi:MAG: hypothetical protein AB8B78_06160 [Polaribacter sp.]
MTIKQNMKENKLLKYVLVSFFAFALMMLNQTLIYALMIPDVCYYHMNEMNSFMNLFYSAGGGSNGHPEPNFLNFVLSLFVGGFIGYKVYILSKKLSKN